MEWLYIIMAYRDKVTDFSKLDVIQKLKRMIAMYSGLHTLDETMALEIIMQEFRLPFQDKKV